jgi:hypothetical protein
VAVYCVVDPDQRFADEKVLMNHYSKGIFCASATMRAGPMSAQPMGPTRTNFKIAAPPYSYMVFTTEE